MNPFTPARCKIGVALLTLALRGIVAPLTAWSQTPAPAEDSKKSFPPDIEKKFTELLSKVGEAKRANLKVRMTKEVEMLSKATALNPEAVKALEAAAQAAVQASTKDCLNKFDTMFR